MMTSLGPARPVISIETTAGDTFAKMSANEEGAACVSAKGLDATCVAGLTGPDDSLATAPSPTIIPTPTAAPPNHPLYEFHFIVSGSAMPFQASSGARTFLQSRSVARPTGFQRRRP
jgi:hypothetical protein